MTATQAPTPGPLSASDVKLLVKGDLLRVTNADSFLEANGVKDGSVVRFRSADNTWIDLQEMDFPQGSSFARFAFIGRPDESGWMPWSGGDPTITDPTVDIEVRLRNGELHVDRSPAFDWTYDPEPHPFDIIAPTAPVEASGSGWEADAWKWLGQLYPNDAPSDLAYDANEMVDAFLAGSGRSDRMAKALERIANEQQYRSGYCQTDITVEPALTAEEAQTVARDALSTTPARAEAPSDDLRTACQAVLDDYQTSDTHHPDHVLIRRTDFDRIKALVEAPVVARAEAQDEGAAGEPVAWRIRRNKGGAGFGRPQVFTTDEATDGDLWQWRRNGYDVQPLYAHPSPTPAADADRVRSVACLTRYSPLSTGNNKAMMQEDEAGLYVLRKQALAALKSTAAKEGGK